MLAACLYKSSSSSSKYYCARSSECTPLDSNDLSLTYNICTCCMNGTNICSFEEILECFKGNLKP